MCSGGNGTATPALPGGSGAVGGGGPSVRSMHRQELARLLASPAEGGLLLVNVSERDEPAGRNPPIAATHATIPLGELLAKAFTDAEWQQQHRATRFVTYCKLGYRGMVAARELSAMGFDACFLAGGAVAWENPVAASFDWVSVFAHDPVAQVDKLSVALSLALTALRGGNSVCVALLANGVFLGLKDDAKRSGIDGANPAPWPPIKEFVEQLVAGGALFMVCHTCMMSRGLDYAQMQPWIAKGTAPDVVRILQGAKGSVQFA